MANTLDIWETPKAEEIYMLAGWRQWADAGSVSSGLPQYLVEQTGARKIGEISPDGFYLFQIPGTHDLVRPAVKFENGYPETLETPRNELFYTGNEERGLVLFIGDEPHMDIERYTRLFLDAASDLGVRRIVGLGGVYGELPYDKERPVSCIYSQPRIKAELNDLAVTLSDYQGGASIGSYVCKRAGERDMDFIGLYAFAPAYDFSEEAQLGSSIRIETDYTAWLGVMRRVNFLLKLGVDLSDLEEKSVSLLELMESKVEEMDNLAPQFGVRDYMQQLAEGFEEVTFNPLDDIWEEELKRLLDKFDEDDQ